MSAETARALTDALYADGDLGPGYMYRDDCEHLATRFLASPWLAEYVATKQAEALREAAADLFAIETDDFHKMHPRTVVGWLRARADRIANPEATP